MVVRLIASANQAHTESTWRYELTSEVENIEVVSRGAGTHCCGSIRAGSVTSSPTVSSSPAWPTRSRPGTSWRS